MSMETAEFCVSEYAELEALEKFLRMTLSDADVRRVPGSPGPGQQGFLDWVAVLGSSNVIVAAIKTLPRFLQTRKPGLSVTVKIKNTSVAVSGANIDEVMRVLGKVLGD